MAIAERRTEYDVRPKSAVKTVWFHGAFVCRRLQGVPDRLRFFLISRTKSRFFEGFQMKIINLRYYYPMFAAPSPCELYEQKNRHTAPYTPLC